MRIDLQLQMLKLCLLPMKLLLQHVHLQLLNLMNHTVKRAIHNLEFEGWSRLSDSYIQIAVLNSSHGHNNSIDRNQNQLAQQEHNNR
ncbi:hypothetical protein D3C79_915600 [compost metagenome]